MTGTHVQRSRQDAGGKAALLCIALAVLLGGCGKEGGGVMPPSSPTQPLTMVRRHIDRAILVLQAHPAPPQHGAM